MEIMFLMDGRRNHRVVNQKEHHYQTMNYSTKGTLIHYRIFTQTDGDIMKKKEILILALAQLLTIEKELNSDPKSHEEGVQ